MNKLAGLYLKIRNYLAESHESEKGQATVDTGQVVMWLVIIAAVVWAIARDAIINFFSRVFGSL